MSDSANAKQLSYSPEIELSVVIPCLNEADTLEACIVRVLDTFSASNIHGELIVADNGSTDASLAIADRFEVKVVHVPHRGYGHALMAGIEAAQGKYVIMGDADGSYDFRSIPIFLTELRRGKDLVQGCRFEAGGGKIMPDAMPVLHRFFGNPLFSALVRLMFGASMKDVYCGLRGFRKDFYLKLNQRCTGMEFAVEMIVKASITKANIAEVPVILSKDGRIAHPPHLKTFRDGWRTLRFLLLNSPTWLFFVPGLFLITTGILFFALALPAVQLGPVTFDAHSLLFGSMAIVSGYQALLFKVFADTFATTVGLKPTGPGLERVFRVLNLERGLLISAVALMIGLSLLTYVVYGWASNGFGGLDYSVNMRLVIPATTMVMLAIETALASFFVSMLGISHR